MKIYTDLETFKIMKNSIIEMESYEPLLNAIKTNHKVLDNLYTNDYIEIGTTLLLENNSEVNEHSLNLFKHGYIEGCISMVQNILKQYDVLISKYNPTLRTQEIIDLCEEISDRCLKMEIENNQIIQFLY